MTAFGENLGEKRITGIARAARPSSLSPTTHVSNDLGYDKHIEIGNESGTKSPSEFVIGVYGTFKRICMLD